MKAALLALVLASTAQARPVIYAITIGNNAPPDDSLARLSYADDDAVRFFEFFSRFGERVRLLTTLDDSTRKRHPSVSGRPATRAELAQVVDELGAAMRADRARGDEVSLYVTFSGHGGRTAQGEAFLALEDGAGLDRAAFREEVLAKLPANVVHVIIDACNAEALLRGRGDEVDAQRVKLTEQQAREAFAPSSLAPHVGVVVATSASGTAHEWSVIESGVFTHELLSALTGAADADGDGAISYPEVSAFIAAANRDIRDPRAVPQALALAPPAAPNTPLLGRVEQRQTATLTGPFSWGRFFIERGNGERYLDAHLSPGFAAWLVLPSEPVFIVAGDREAEVHLQPGQSVAAEALTLRKRSVTKRGSIEQSFRDQLFLSDFGPAFYRGYLEASRAPALRVERSETGRAELRRPLAIASFVAGGLGLVASGVTAGLALAANDDYRKTQLQRPAAEAFARANAFAVASLVSLGVAIAFGLGGWALWPSGPRVSLAMGPGEAALVWGSTW